MTAQALRPLERAILDCGAFDTRTELVIVDLLQAAYNLGLSAGQARPDTLPDIYQARQALPAPVDDYEPQYRAPVIIGGRYDR